MCYSQSISHSLPGSSYGMPCGCAQLLHCWTTLGPVHTPTHLLPALATGLWYCYTFHSIVYSSATEGVGKEGMYLGKHQTLESGLPVVSIYSEVCRPFPTHHLCVCVCVHVRVSFIVEVTVLLRSVPSMYTAWRQIVWSINIGFIGGMFGAYPHLSVFIPTVGSLHSVCTAV